MDKLPKGAIRAYREHLNKVHGTERDYTNEHKTGNTKRAYGDYLYAQDREMFMVSLHQELEAGTFKLDAEALKPKPKAAPLPKKASPKTLAEIQEANCKAASEAKAKIDSHRKR